MLKRLRFDLKDALRLVNNIDSQMLQKVGVHWALETQVNASQLVTHFEVILSKNVVLASLKWGVGNIVGLGDKLKLRSQVVGQ